MTAITQRLSSALDDRYQIERHLVRGALTRRERAFFSPDADAVRDPLGGESDRRELACPRRVLERLVGRT